MALQGWSLEVREERIAVNIGDQLVHSSLGRRAEILELDSTSTVAILTATQPSNNTFHDDTALPFDRNLELYTLSNRRGRQGRHEDAAIRDILRHTGEEIRL